MGACRSRLGSRTASDTTRETARTDGSDDRRVRSKTNANITQTPFFAAAGAVADDRHVAAVLQVANSHKSNADAQPAAANTQPRVESPPKIDLGGGALGFLPVELLRSGVLSFLDAGCLARAGGARRAWREAATDEHLWKRLCLRHWVGKHVGEQGRFFCRALECIRRGVLCLLCVARGGRLLRGPVAWVFVLTMTLSILL